MLDVSYSACLIALNYLFLCKYRFFKGNTSVETLLEETITTIIYFMLSILLVKLCWESFPLSWLCSLGE